MKILFVGESWLGSCARSLREALARIPEVELDEFNEDAVFPAARARWLRAIGRLLYPFYRRDFNQQLTAKACAFQPDVLVTYKGTQVHADLIQAMRSQGILTVNVYPDCSPHSHGMKHRLAVGEYDLVVSSKAYHPGSWADTYGYTNSCVFVPQGYDPTLHLSSQPPADFEYDLVMVATYRAEYGELLENLGRLLPDPEFRVVIGGYGWNALLHRFPSHWKFPGRVEGKGYLETLRKGKICIAPLNRSVSIQGQHQPGDVDTTRTYELAAAQCFFIHQRTDFARGLYTEDEVPMFDDASELADHIRQYLPKEELRTRMASAAHRRAVPAYSIDARAAEVVAKISAAFKGRL